MNSNLWVAAYGTSLAALVAGLLAIAKGITDHLLSAPERERDRAAQERVRSDEQSRLSEQRTDERDAAFRKEYDTIIQRQREEIASNREEKKFADARIATLEAGIVQRTQDIYHWQELHANQKAVQQHSNFVIFLLRRERKELLQAMATLHEYLESSEHSKLDCLQIVAAMEAKLLLDIEVPDDYQNE